MSICKQCGNDYHNTFVITMNGESHTFDSFECAIAQLAPSCEQCGNRIIGHGVEALKHVYCCAHYAHLDGVSGTVDHVRTAMVSASG
jgi:hypothetical protein